MRIVMAAAICVLLTGAAWAQKADDAPPPECRYDAAGGVDYQACLRVSPPGSPWRLLSLINLGTEAFARGDFAAAVGYYDQAQPANGEIFYSDAAYHAYRANALHHVGRAPEAIVEARRSLAVLRNDASLPPAVRERFGSVQVDRELVYAAVLPVLHAAGDAETARVRADFMALPASGWWTWANRAGVMEQLGDIQGALGANAEALRMAPNEPGVLNNQCYILFRAERAAEALPFCQRAVAGAPEVASVRHSVAATLAALGRCREAAAELAQARRLDPVAQEYQRELACTDAN